MLTAANGAWTNSPKSFTYQWIRAGTPIGGATASTYIPIATDVGNRLTFSVVATNSGGSASATSAATSAVTLSYDSGNLLTNTNTYPISSQSKPAYLGSYVDPIFGTTITRITGDVGVTIPTVGGTWPNVARQAYNMRPVWNADESLMVLENVVGSGGPLFLDGKTYAPLFKGAPPAAATEYRWSHTDPNLFDWVGTSGTNAVFGTWNPRTGVTITTATFGGYTGTTVGGKGNWSLDGNVVAVLATRVSDSKQVAFSVNLSQGTKSVDIDLAASGFLPFGPSEGGPRISPKGELIYVSGRLSAGQQQSDNAIIFDLQGNVVQTWIEYGVPSHFDLGISLAGDEVAVGVVKTVTQGVPTGHIAMRNLRTGALTDLVTGGYSTAVSTRNYGMPGWAIVDDVDAYIPNNYPPYDDEIFAVKLDGSKTVVRMGQSHAAYTDYDTQGFVVPSPSGTRIVFASDWNASGNPSRPVQAYVIDIRKNLGLP